MLAFDLTPLTRGAARERRTTWKGFDLKVETVVVSMLSAALGLLPTVILWPWLGSVAILAIPVTIGAAIVLIQGRSKRGLRLRNWQTLRNRVGSNRGKFMVNGRPFDPLGFGFGAVLLRAMPAPERAIPDLDDLLGLNVSSRRARTQAPSDFNDW